MAMSLMNDMSVYCAWYECLLCLPAISGRPGAPSSPEQNSTQRETSLDLDFLLSQQLTSLLACIQMQNPLDYPYVSGSNVL